MAAHLVAFARWLALLALGSLLATACVRTEPPLSYTCASQDDCAADEICRSGTCLPIGTCSNEYDCDRQHQICRESRCVNVVCTFYNEESCGAFGCDGQANVCRTSCSIDDDCASGAYCDQRQCVVGTRPRDNDELCSENAQCNSGVCCARSGGKVCSDRCEPAGATCKTAKDCKDSFCCARFASDSFCSSTPCLAMTSCTSDTSCEVGEFCANGSCAKKLANGGKCVANRECFSGRCSSGQCLAQLGDPCQKPTDCALEQTCCVLRKGGTAECAIASATCLGQTGDACEFDLECADGLCQDGLFCSKPCFDSAECGVGPFSVANVCVETFGDSLCYPGCTTAAQCQSIYDPYDSICAADGEANYCDLY